MDAGRSSSQGPGQGPVQGSGRPVPVRWAAFEGAGQPFSMVSRSLPPLQNGELLLRVLACTLCGSDGHSRSGRREAPSSAVLGHEIVGEVLGWRGQILVVDPDLGLLRVGQRVVGTLVASCGSCARCRGGLPQKCEQAQKHGHEAVPEDGPPRGGLATHCVLHAGTTVFRVPFEMPDALAALATCAGATVAAALRSLVPDPAHHERAVVFGAGALGLLAVAMLHEVGVPHITAVDPDAQRRQLAEAFGAGHSQPPEAVLPPAHTDLVLETSGASAAVQSALACAAPGGRIALIGSVFPGEALAFHPEDWIRRHLSVHGIHNYAPRDLGTALRFLEDPSFPFAKLLGPSFSLDEVEAAFDAAATGQHARVVITPQAASPRDRSRTR